MKNKSLLILPALSVLFSVFLAVSWIVNLVKFIQCDFQASWRDEIIHGIGVFFALPSIVTAWI